MQDLENMLESAMEHGRIAGDALVIIPRDVAIALRDKLRAERHQRELAEEKLSPTQLRVYTALAARRGELIPSVDLMRSAKVRSLSSLRVAVQAMRFRLPEAEIVNRPGRGYCLKAVS